MASGYLFLFWVLFGFHGGAMVPTTTTGRPTYVSTTQTTVTPIRLVNGTRTSYSLSGRLEVFHNNTWGTVCDDSFSSRSARVVCGLLWFSTGYPVSNAVYGRGTGVIWLDDVVCSGSETSISQCSHRPWGLHNCGHYEDLGLVCSNNVAVTPIRLVNGIRTPNSLSGRLEVFHNNAWGTVCDDSFSSISARVVCGFLGFSQGYPVNSAGFGAGTGVIWLDDVVCSGNETSISQCSHRPWGHHDCGHIEDLGLVCSNNTEVTSIRLVNGTRTPNSLSGRLEVFYNNTWGTVCDDSFSTTSARVVCGFLGFSRGHPVNRAGFGEGTGVIWLDDVVCSGNETSISQCSHRPWGENNCGHHEDLGLVCSNDTTATSVRLVNGTRTTNSLSGRLEVYHNRTWGTVCDDGFTSRTARVICGLLEFSQGVELSSAYFGQGTGPIWLDDIRCSGNETDISQCSDRGWGVHNCWHAEDVGLVCFNSNLQGSVQTRLVGGVRGSGWQTGRLEVFFAGEWGTVCNRRFNNATASVACRSAGYRFGNYVYRSYPSVRNPMIWLGGAICRGHERNIAQCQHAGWGYHSCSHSSDVNVICSNSRSVSNPCFLPSYEPCGSLSDGCFNSSSRCDRRWNCRNGFDESACSTRTTTTTTTTTTSPFTLPVCQSTEFRCDNGTCLPITFRCDGTITCPGGEDERSCVTQSGNRLTVNSNGELYTVCSGSSDFNNRHLAHRICIYLGYSAVATVSVERTRNLPVGMVFYPTASFAGYLGEQRPYLSLFCAPLNVRCSNLVSGCGRPSVPLARNYVQFGHDALPGQWPWQVHLKRNGRNHCGGILLNNRWVATATHCIVNYPASAFRVVLGSHRSTVVESYERQMRVARIVRHSNYTVTNGRPNNDISLLYLTGTVRFSSYIQPVCLPQTPLNGREVCYLTGWGREETGRNPSTLQQIRVRTFQHELCNIIKENSDVIPSRLCAVIPSRYAPACYGDSGGPLVCLNKAGRWEVHGMSSYGPRGCRTTRKTGVSVYTNIHFYRSWIQRTITS